MYVGWLPAKVACRIDTLASQSQNVQAFGKWLVLISTRLHYYHIAIQYPYYYIIIQGPCQIYSILYTSSQTCKVRMHTHTHASLPPPPHTYAHTHNSEYSTSISPPANPHRQYPASLFQPPPPPHPAGQIISRQDGGVREPVLLFYSCPVHWV